MSNFLAISVNFSLSSIFLIILSHIKSSKWYRKNLAKISITYILQNFDLEQMCTSVKSFIALISTITCWTNIEEKICINSPFLTKVFTYSNFSHFGSFLFVFAMGDSFIRPEKLFSSVYILFLILPFESLYFHYDNYFRYLFLS